MLGSKLRIGDTIGIVAPSNHVINGKNGIQRCIDYLTNKGFKVKLSKHLFKVDGMSAGTEIQRASDINDMFKDKEVKAIICADGGSTSNGVLPLLDYQLIQDNPKLFIGLSDITVLINAIYTKIGLVTYHGNNAIYGFGSKNPADYEYEEFKSRFIEEDNTYVVSNGERKEIRKGIVEGKLIGGNLRCLLNLAGTPYFPDCSDAILFLEAYDITDYQCEFMFNHLKQMGVFDKIKGVIVGYIWGLQHKETDMQQMEEVLLKVTKDYSFPILKCNDFGHNIPNTILPIGIKTRINTNDLTIEFLERCVND